MTALYDNPDISHREHWAPERGVEPKVRRKAADANGVRFCGVGREGRRPPRGLRRGSRGEQPGVAVPTALRTALTRGPGGVAQCCGSSRPAAAAARAVIHHATALMAGPGGPGSARFCSARSGRAGVPEAAAQLKREPNATAWTAERNDPGTGHGEVKAQLLRTSGRDARSFREKVREDTGGFFRYRASKNLAVLGEETALMARRLNQDPRERWPGREKPAPTGRSEGHAASRFVRLHVKTLPVAP